MASQKKPSWQFYPGDWMKDTELRSVSSAARGIWIDMLCLMHESGRRGYLQVNGRPASLEQIARMTGNSTEEAALYLQELIDSGVCSRTKDGIDGDGCIYSRRMVRDEANKKAWRENGKKGGNQKLAKSENLVGNLDNQISDQKGQGGVNQKGRSSSSTSVKESLFLAHAHDREEGKEKEQEGAPPGAYPEIPDDVFDYAVHVLCWMTPDVPLKSLLLDYPPDWVLKGMKTLAANKKTKRTPTYLRGILENFRRNGGPDDDAGHTGRGTAGANQTKGREAPDYSDIKNGERL